MSGGGIENHWRLRGGDGYLIIRFFIYLKFFLSSDTGYGLLLI